MHCRKLSIILYKRWTVGESDSRLSRARRLHCHYANGPDKIILTESVAKGDRFCNDLPAGR